MRLDKDGYLQRLEDWNETTAAELAVCVDIELTSKHWEIIHLLREFHATYEHAPSMRPLVKWVATHLGKTKGNSVYLMQLFPGNPAKLGAKIAGLPRPTNCL